MTALALYVATVQAELVSGCEIEHDQIAQICLTSSSGTQIHDPLHGENGFGTVDSSYYGLTERQRADVVAVNEAIARFVSGASDQMAKIVQSVLNTTDGDIASQVYQGQANSEFLIAASTLMANHALAEIQHKWESR